jgi:hypothetical protein
MALYHLSCVASHREENGARMKGRLPQSFRRAGVLAVIAGLILIASGISSSSMLLTGLDYLDNHIGSSIGTAGQSLLQLTIATVGFLVGLGGISAIVGGILLLRGHGSSGRFLIGLGGGTAIFGLLISIGEALFASGTSAPIFYQPYFALYWIGAILATVSILVSRRDPATKPII